MGDKFQDRSWLPIFLSVLLCSCLGGDQSFDQQIWYLDADNDGFGSSQEQIMSCEQPPRYVNNQNDCNDANNQVYLGTLEVQNGLDDNCNGNVDECDNNRACQGICLNNMCADILSGFSCDFTKYSFDHTLTSAVIPYSFFAPQQSLGAPEQMFPLIIALHGAEYLGISQDQFLARPDLAKLVGYFALGWIKQEVQVQYPAFVVAPHIHSDISSVYSDWSSLESTHLINKLLDQILEDNPAIDSERGYLIGHSMGGE